MHGKIDFLMVWVMSCLSFAYLAVSLLRFELFLLKLKGKKPSSPETTSSYFLEKMFVLTAFNLVISSYYELKHSIAVKREEAIVCTVCARKYLVCLRCCSC